MGMLQVVEGDGQPLLSDNLLLQAKKLERSNNNFKEQFVEWKDNSDSKEDELDSDAEEPSSDETDASYFSSVGTTPEDGIEWISKIISWSSGRMSSSDMADMERGRPGERWYWGDSI